MNKKNLWNLLLIALVARIMLEAIGLLTMTQEATDLNIGLTFLSVITFSIVLIGVWERRNWGYYLAVIMNLFNLIVSVSLVIFLLVFAEASEVLGNLLFFTSNFIFLGLSLAILWLLYKNMHFFKVRKKEYGKKLSTYWVLWSLTVFLGFFFLNSMITNALFIGVLIYILMETNKDIKEIKASKMWLALIFFFQVFGATAYYLLTKEKKG